MRTDLIGVNQQLSGKVPICDWEFHGAETRIRTSIVKSDPGGTAEGIPQHCLSSHICVVMSL